MFTVKKNESLVSHIQVAFELEIKSLIYSRKWIIYIILSLAPLMFSILNSNRLGVGNENGVQAFMGVVMNYQFGFFYVFGVLLLALPFTSDEITDHVMDLFLIKPLHKEIIYFTRYVALVLASSIINGILVVIYYVYYFLIDNRSLDKNLGLLTNVILFFLIANLLYSALFIGIGFLGSKGFGIGVFVAIIELFALNILFLSNDPLVPRTNLQIIANDLLGSAFNYNYKNNFIPSLSSLVNAYLYIFVVTIGLLVVGFLYFKRKDFD